MRVALEEVEVAYGDDDDDTELEGMESAAPTREDMKKQAEDKIYNKTAKKKNKKKAGGFGGDASGGKAAGGGKGGSRAPVS